ncbi:hypothetical protein FOA52_004837 [Chlamydomonas sp. UWO 241]|nr:hypothetical protein FOA52_004837 [Chlamydomonas sp. UWO 241]
MALMMKSTSTTFSGKVARKAAVARPMVCKAQAAAGGSTRPMWYPGNPAPAHLDGSLPGDYGFDPLSLGSEPKLMAWFVQAELQNGRWAMMGVAGILFTSIGAAAGLPLPQWYDAGEVAQASSTMSFGTLVMVQLLMMGWVEAQRAADMQNPGSQGKGEFLGVTDEFSSTTPGYPGGKFFDPFGLSMGPKFEQYKVAEIKNARLAMVAFVGFICQHAATGKGPIENLSEHMAAPYTTTFATNGVSVPFQI